MKILISSEKDGFIGANVKALKEMFLCIFLCLCISASNVCDIPEGQLRPFLSTDMDGIVEQ